MVKKMKKNKIIDQRILWTEIFVVALFLILAFTLTRTIYFKRSFYEEKLASLTEIIIEGESAPRGRIYDRNYKLLVDNVSVPVIYYQKEEDISAEEEIELAYQIIKKVSLPYEKLTIRNLKEFWLAQNNDIASSRITAEEYEKLKRRELNSSDIENLKIDRITDEDLAVYQEEDKQAAYLYYLMNRGYSYEQKIIKDEGVTDQEYSYFSENSEYLSGFNTKITWEREYLYGDTLRSILGSINSVPKEDKAAYLASGYALNDVVGVSNLEKQYEYLLKGTKATYRKINDHQLEKVSDAIRGNDIVLTIDIELQQAVDKLIDRELIRAKSEANTRYLSKTYAIIQQPQTGEVLALSGRQLVKEGKSYKGVDISSYALTDPMAPGSVVKGASMLVGYNTRVLQIGEVMTDECIKIKSIPAKCSSHRVGSLNDIIALAESSNVYQFKIAMRVGKGNYRYNEPLIIDPAAFQIYRKTFSDFGLGVKTGIDLPVESLGYIGKSVKPEFLLNYAIGQYDTYTPIQLSQYITTIASDGKRLQPHLLKAVYEPTDGEELGKLAYEIEPIILNTVDTQEIYLDRIQEGFRAVMTIGLGKNVMGKAPDSAGKTGTSESFMDTDNDGKIDTATVSNAFVGYAPFDDPVMSITVTSPDVEDPSTGISFHSYVNRRIARYISNYYFYGEL